MTSPQEPPTAAINDSTITNEEATTTIEAWLNQRLRITITDGRSFEGWFKCVDRDCNIVLSGSEEFRDGRTPPLRSALMADKQRFIGLIVVPGKHVVSVELIHPAKQSVFV